MSLARFVCAAVLAVGSAAAGKAPARPAASTATIHGEVASSIFFVPVSVNGRVFQFEIDSGFEESVLDPETVKALHLTAVDNHVEDAPGGSMQVAHVAGARLVVGGVALPPRDLAVVKLRQFAPFFGHAVDGILGYDFFERFVVTLDYAERTVTIREPASFTPPPGAHATPIVIRGNQPYVDAAAVLADGRSVTGSFELDTGSADVVDVHAPFVAAKRLLLPGVKTFTMRGISLGGETLGKLARMGDLQLGDRRVRAPLFAITDDKAERAGQLGGGLLSRFRVTFDYERSRVFFEPNAHFDDRFGFDRAGVLLVADAPRFDTFKVLQVLAGTEAERAGLREGDRVKAIDGAPIAGFSLEQLREKLKTLYGKHRVTIERTGRTVELDLILHDLI